MYRGTTPSINFVVPQDTPIAELSELYITFNQENKTVLEFSKSSDEVEFVISENTIRVNLTQEDTLKLNADYKVQIQLRAKTVGGVALATPIMKKDVLRILKDGVI